ncbi:phage major tail protein, TP901-1 family [Mogibacterium sp.]|jgi:TP901-1 family phage major tail protein|uniref:Major tail protein n=1 Tax=Myoviridae sp. ctegP15 TaxID=2825146 RepID=A0A8S5P367_9CAUD|nr:phage major tail protein, TP901-1 family [Mogibacterium sp.]DAE01085.1 MAG TPA: major tail protein [Myoviridae sp. ctegP15]DAE43608.1 MAG TPA: major tail protein [Caudoviricetes sp.]MBN2935965.1 phage major tail protein, TP901-1 family [Mogibacterium sp.]DAG81591.1 MAG TPA: major tail protein [Caudoviricetes sp.]DAH85271.1 MAG TPA: major tail protein [Caudoviricetes sp.]
MATAIAGKKIIYLYRLLEDASKEAAKQIAFVTENGRTKSKDADSTATKDGTIRTPATAEVEITCTSILAKGDTMLDKLESALDNDKLIEVWEANMDEPVESKTNQYKGTYFQGYLTEIERTANAEDMVEVSLTFGINGAGAKGNVTVTDTQADMASYVFKDTTVGA